MKRLLYASIAFFCTTLLFSFHVITSYGFDIDMGRDLMDMSRILTGDITLVGPKLSFGGYFSGPYYYYLFLPFLWIAQGNVSGLLYANAVLFAAPIAAVFYIFSGRVGYERAAMITAWIASSPYLLFAARHPGNAFSYLAPLLLWCTGLIYLKKDSLLIYGLMGLAAGVIGNFHPVAFIAIAPLVIFRLIRRDMCFKKTGMIALGILVSYAPLILFELTHGFIMTKNTFVTGSLEKFVGNQNIGAQAAASTNPFQNMIFISFFMKDWIHPPVIVVTGLLIVLAYFLKNTHARILVAFFTATYFLSALVFRFQLSFHYLLPLIVLLQVVAVYVLSQSRPRLQILVFGVFILYNLILFPWGYYRAAPRRFDQLKSRTEKALTRLKAPKKNINVIALRTDPITLPAADYRYIMRLLGYNARRDTEYNGSRYVLVIREDANRTIEKTSSWELEQIGPMNRMRQFRAGPLYTLYNAR